MKLHHRVQAFILACLGIVVGADLGLGGCAHVPKPIVDFGRCVSTAVAPQVEDIIGDVETALASANTASLLDIGARVGWAAVDCAVHEVLGHAYVRRSAAPSDELTKTTIETGQRWLKDHGGRS